VLSRPGPIVLAPRLVIAGLFLASCGGTSAAPTALPRLPTRAQTPAAAPTSAPPVATSGKGELAAVTEVVRRYFHDSNALRSTMDATSLAALFTSTCPCQAQVKSVRAARARGQIFVGRATVNALRASANDPRDAVVLADYDFAHGGVINSTGGWIHRFRNRRHIKWLFALRLTDGEWLISRIDRAS
jgi:hypothetical protein